MYGERGKAVYCNYGECTVSVVRQFIHLPVGALLQDVPQVVAGRGSEH